MGTRRRTASLLIECASLAGSIAEGPIAALEHGLSQPEEHVRQDAELSQQLCDRSCEGHPTLTWSEFVDTPCTTAEPSNQVPPPHEAKDTAVEDLVSHVSEHVCVQLCMLLGMRSGAAQSWAEAAAHPGAHALAWLGLMVR
jgi:hypothetical protein